MDRIAPKPEMAVKRKRLTHYFPPQLGDRLTPRERLFVTSSMGEPVIDITDWRLEITGLVSRPMSLSFDELMARPKRVYDSVFICSGNPAQPTKPLRRASNVRWGGIDLATLLDEAGILPEATYLWSYGLDHGTYNRTAQEHYVKDMPRARLEGEDVLIAYELNDAPLSQAHGFPARLVIPDYYGTNSVKWLGRIELTDSRAGGIFTTRYYNDQDPAAGKGATTPVWSLAPESLIVSPAPKEELAPGLVEIRGWAWSDCPAAALQVSIDGGKTWNEAALEPAAGRAWQQFSYNWTPTAPGAHDLRCRATDVNGRVQPARGARNAIQSVKVTVRDS